MATTCCLRARMAPASAGSILPRPRWSKRIFALFAAGTSPRAIAKQLNAEGVPGPDGRDWRDTTIRGQLDRGTGILNNALYAGRLEWNRCAYVKDPRTGKRVARPNPRAQWEVVPVPELRIVDDALWDAVKARQAEVRLVMSRDADGNALNGAHRQKYLLSGLLACGVCGGGFTIVNAHDYGCATHRAKGTCEQPRQDQARRAGAPRARRPQASAAGARAGRAVCPRLPRRGQPPGGRAEPEPGRRTRASWKRCGARSRA